jgi:hypothetical protein
VKTLALVGGVLILLSFMNLGAGGTGSYVGPGAFTGVWIRTGGDFLLTVESDHEDAVSIFVLNYDDTIRAINSSSTMNTHPVFELVNVTQFSGRIQIILPGLYSVLVTSWANDTDVDIDVSPILPMTSFAISGFTLLVAGVILHLTGKHVDANRRKT